MSPDTGALLARHKIGMPQAIGTVTLSTMQPDKE